MDFKQALNSLYQKALPSKQLPPLQPRLRFSLYEDVVVLKNMFDSCSDNKTALFLKRRRRQIYERKRNVLYKVTEQHLKMIHSFEISNYKSLVLSQRNNQFTLIPYPEDNSSDKKSRPSFISQSQVYSPTQKLLQFQSSEKKTKPKQASGQKELICQLIQLSKGQEPFKYQQSVLLTSVLFCQETQTFLTDDIIKLYQIGHLNKISDFSKLYRYYLKSIGGTEEYPLRKQQMKRALNAVKLNEQQQRMKDFIIKQKAFGFYGFVNQIN